jgi:hypothetical protein
MKYWSNTLSTYKSRNEDDPLCADECYTIKKNICMIHGFKQAMKRIAIPEICELCNLFAKPCNISTRKARHFCAIIRKTLDKS